MPLILLVEENLILFLLTDQAGPITNPVFAFTGHFTGDGFVFLHISMEIEFPLYLINTKPIWV